MFFVIYAFKVYNVFCHLRFQRLQCLQSFTLLKTTMSSVLCFQDYNVSCSMIYKTSMSFVLLFFKDFDVFYFIFHRIQCPRLFFIGLNVFVFVFLRTQVLFFYAVKKIYAYKKRRRKRRRTSNIFHSTKLQCPYVSSVSLPWFPLVARLNSKIAQTKLVSLSLLPFYVQ